MKIDGFTDIPLVNNTWSFFAISCDYTQGEAIIFLKVFDGSPNNSFSKNIALDFREFSLEAQSNITLASVEKNEYFDSVSGYVGNIAYLEMSSFFSKKLDTLWTGYQTSSSYGYKGVILNLDLAMYNQRNPKIQSTGLINENYEITGNFEPLFEVDENQLGARFRGNSFLNLNEIDIANND